MNMGEIDQHKRASLLSELLNEITNCHNCELHRSRTTVVPGEGSFNADIVFIGEAPGFHEDQQGRPFVGPAGHFLDELLSSIGLNREQVYICNMIKCRPPQNRDPLISELQTCQQWLDQQLELLQPKIIVTLGRYSMARFFPGQTISKAHGKSRVDGDIVYYAMYHPAAALHQQSLRQTILDDMKKIPQLLSKTAKPTETEENPQQLNLF
jgi:DNA polymerase